MCSHCFTLWIFWHRGAWRYWAFGSDILHPILGLRSIVPAKYFYIIPFGVALAKSLTEIINLANTSLQRNMIIFESSSLHYMTCGTSMTQFGIAWRALSKREVGGLCKQSAEMSILECVGVLMHFSRQGSTNNLFKSRMALNAYRLRYNYVIFLVCCCWTLSLSCASSKNPIGCWTKTTRWPISTPT